MPTSHLKNTHILFSNNEEHLAESKKMLAKIGFADWQKARAALRRFGDTAETQTTLLEILPGMLFNLQNSANPDQALLNFEHFLDKQAQPAHIFKSFTERPRSLEMLIQLFAGSQFLSDVLIKSPSFFEYIKKWCIF